MHKKQKKDLFLQNYVNSFGHVSKSCMASKIGRSTFYNWINPKEKEYDKDFADAVSLADASFVEIVEDEVWKKIKDGSDLWMWRYLTTHSPERWKASESDEQVHTGTIQLKVDRKII